VAEGDLERRYLENNVFQISLLNALSNFSINFVESIHPMTSTKVLSSYVSEAEKISGDICPLINLDGTVKIATIMSNMSFMQSS
jgi:hypothetical protein